RQVEIRCYPKSRSALVDQVLTAIIASAKLLNDSRIERTSLRKLSQGIGQRFQARLAETLPISNRLHLSPRVSFPFPDLLEPIANMTIYHLRQLKLFSLLVTEDSGF